MDNISKIVEAFVNGESTEEILPVMAEWLMSVKDTVETVGRIQEINNMLRYHREMASAAETNTIRKVHLEAVATLETRLKKLNSTGVILPRPPIT